MKSIAAIFALAAMILAARAEEASRPPLTTGSSTYLSGYVDTMGPGHSKKSLIHSHRRGTIQYVKLPEVSWPFSGGPLFMDLNGDGVLEFGLSSETSITLSIPGNISSVYQLQCLGSSQVLTSSTSIAVMPFGSLISSNGGSQTFFKSKPASWSGLLDVVTLTTFSGAWSGSLGEFGIGYMGVRFWADDGVHNGWIRVQLPVASAGINDLTPTMLDFAYETRPDMPIRAGAVSSTRRVKEFVISLWNPDGSPRYDNEGQFSYATAFLIGNTLRCDLHVSGTFSNAALVVNNFGNGRFWKRIVPPTRLDSPRIDLSQSDLTVFFGDIKLNAVQLELLRRGRLQIDIGNGAVTGMLDQMAWGEAEREHVGSGGSPPNFDVSPALQPLP